MPEIPAPAPTNMNATGGAATTDANLAGATYEQITQRLKDQAAKAPEPEPTELNETDPTEPEPQAQAPKDQPTVEEFYRLTDAQIAALSPEAQGHLKRIAKDMQAAYTRKTQALAEERRALEAQRPEPQAQASTQTQPQAQPAGDTPPPGFIEMTRQQLPPELHWMAEHIAKANWATVRTLYGQAIKPLQDKLNSQETQQAERERQARLSDVGAAQDEFAGRTPGWEAHEDAMVEALEFMASKDLRHPRFGNKYDLLWKIVQGDQAQSQATQAALQHMADKAKSKSVTATTSQRGTATNTEDRVRGAKTDAEAWRIIREQGATAR